MEARPTESAGKKTAPEGGSALRRGVDIYVTW